MSSERIGDKIKKLRLEFNMTQKKLADLLDISPSTIGMYEQNRRVPDVDSIVRLADTFEVTTDYLLGNEKATQTEQPASQKLKNLIDSYADLSEDEIDQVTNFVAFLRTKRNF